MFVVKVIRCVDRMSGLKRERWPSCDVACVEKWRDRDGFERRFGVRIPMIAEPSADSRTGWLWVWMDVGWRPTGSWENRGSMRL